MQALKPLWERVHAVLGWTRRGENCSGLIALPLEKLLPGVRALPRFHRCLVLG
jgi:hypothetical protein